MKTGDFLDSIYVPKKNPEMRRIMGGVVDDVNSCIEAGVLWQKDIDQLYPDIL